MKILGMIISKQLLTGLALFVWTASAMGQPPEATPATPQTGQPATGEETKADRASADSATPAPKAGDRMEIEIAPGIKMAFRWCPPGKFMMGSPATEERRSTNETQHEVTLSNGFWLAETEVTQAQWRAVTSEEPTNFLGDKLPVQSINWHKAQYFVNLAKKSAGMTMRLPTEAEWEYACRAGATTPFAYGNFMNGTEANIDGDNPQPYNHPKGPSRKKPIEVASFKPNAWGLHDMHGNVLEWCADWYGDFTSAPATDPTGPEKGEQRVARGSSWDDFGSQCRSACRDRYEPTRGVGDLGFRPVLSPNK